MAYRLFGTKPLSKPMLAYHQVNTQGQFPVKFEGETSNVVQRVTSGAVNQSVTVVHTSVTANRLE